MREVELISCYSGNGGQITHAKDVAERPANFDLSSKRMLSRQIILKETIL